MSSKIIEQSNAYDGGIVFLVGFYYRHLINLLDLNQPDFYRYAIFADSKTDQYLNRMSSAESRSWSQLSNEKFRTRFYRTSMQFFDLEKKPSFETIENKCQLLNYPIKSPTVGVYLSKATNQDYSFTIDSQYAVTATATMTLLKLGETVNGIKRNFPGLRFFTKQKNMEGVLHIPGINSAENYACLKKGSVELDVMKP
jgi:hypothetical protein